jgi:hypothetical protein
MREAPLTDSQKTDKDLDGSYPSRVGTREVTARLKDGSWTKRGRGGAAMNSTATELEFTRRRAMRGIVKGFVIGILGLAGLLVPVGYVHALDSKESCGQQGFILCKDGACGSRKCWCNNKVLTPGETCSNTLAGKTYFYMCDGCSGKVVTVIKPTTPQRGLVKPPAGGTLQK